MNKNLFVVFLSALLSTFATMTFSAQICGDNFSWTQGSNVSPNDTACRTVTHTTDNANDWTPFYQSGAGQMRLFSPAVTAHIPLQFGSCTGGFQFPVGPGAVFHATLSSITQGGYDGAVWRVSRDNCATWSEASTLGITGMGYNTMMSSSTTLELPPTGLRGIMAYSGSFSGTVSLIFPSSTVPGNAIFQLYFVSNSGVSASGSSHVTAVDFYASPLAQPSITCTPGNSNFKVGCVRGDSRTINVTVRDGANVIATSCDNPIDITNQTNGVTHNITVTGDDGIGNVSPPASCSVTPICVPGINWATSTALIRLSKLFGTDVKLDWALQTTEKDPCTGGPVHVAGYNVYQANNPSGPWTLIGSAPYASPTVDDPGELLSSISRCYRQDNITP